MRRTLILLLVATATQFAFTCEKGASEDPTPACATPATIRNLAKLDGCGYALVLADGKRLEPAGEAWDAYPKEDGAAVTISYTPDSRASICMSGQTVRLTCIQPQTGPGGWCGTR